MLLKKKLCAVRLVLAAILLTMVAWVPGVQNVWADASVSAGNSQQIGNFTLYMDPDEEKLTDCEVNEDESGNYELVIPEKVAGIPVKHIGEGAFSWCRELTKLVLPSSVESIGTEAFSECTELKEINIPNNVVRIEPYAFYFCESLERVTLPNRLVEIGESAFSGSGLIEVTIPGSVKRIGRRAFWDIFDNFVIRGYKGTEAEQYAARDNLIFVALEGEFPSTPSEPETEKMAQTITAKSFTKTCGNKPFKLGASAKTGLTYKSSDTSVATVNSKGIVTLKGPGKTSITITAAANSKYKKATKKVTITVKPKKMEALQVKSKKAKTITVSWKKDGKVTGYELMLAQNSKFTKGKGVIKIPYNTSNTTTIGKLQKGKTYYFKIRSYKKVGTTTLYGAYSKVKSIKVK